MALRRAGVNSALLGSRGSILVSSAAVRVRELLDSGFVVAAGLCVRVGFARPGGGETIPVFRAK